MHLPWPAQLTAISYLTSGRQTQWSNHFQSPSIVGPNIGRTIDALLVIKATASHTRIIWQAAATHYHRITLVTTP